MVNYPELKDFFTYETEIHGIKVSFDRDVFKQLSPKNNIQFKLLKDIKKGEELYKRLSKSQKQISNIINDNDKSVKKGHRCGMSFKGLGSDRGWFLISD